MVKKMGRVYLVRHGKTKYNASGAGERIRGRARVPLDADGKKDAREAAAFLKDYNIERISASDMPRTQETASIIADALGVKWRVDAGLGPWDLGFLTGKLVEDAWPLVQKFEKNPDMNVPDGVSYREWWERFYDTLWKYIGWAKGGAPNTLLISHVRNLTATADILKSREPNALDWAKGPEPGSVMEVCIGRTCTPKLIKGRYQDKTLRS